MENDKLLYTPEEAIKRIRLSTAVLSEKINKVLDTMTKNQERIARSGNEHEIAPSIDNNITLKI